MPPVKRNPKNLNPLQLRTLTILQKMAEVMGEDSADIPGARVIGEAPHVHGNHLHIGDVLVSGRDATGLANEAVWVALERKGMVKTLDDDRVAVLPEGLAYDTGMASQILHESDHGAHEH